MYHKKIVIKHHFLPYYIPFDSHFVGILRENGVNPRAIIKFKTSFNRETGDFEIRLWGRDRGYRRITLTKDRMFSDIQ